MPTLSKLDRKSLMIGSACFIAGFGFGIILEQWLLWNRQVGRFNELIRRLAIIEDEIRVLKVRLKGVRNDISSTPKLTAVSKPIYDTVDNEDLIDNESETDEFMSVGSEMSSIPSVYEVYFTEIDRLLDGSLDEKKNAYHRLREKRVKLCDDVDFLWRWARAAYSMFYREGGATDERAKQYIYEALSLAEKALIIDDKCAAAHKWYAVIIGIVGECEGTQAKIKNGYEFKKHIERALELDPQDYEAHYLRGRFCYGVYMLTWVERQLASALFATPPTATIEDARSAFLECENLEPNHLKRNQLYLARCEIELRNYSEAVTWLESANNITTEDAFDEEYEKEIDDLIGQYSHYKAV